MEVMLVTVCGAEGWLVRKWGKRVYILEEVVDEEVDEPFVAQEEVGNGLRWCVVVRV